MPKIPIKPVNRSKRITSVTAKPNRSPPTTTRMSDAIAMPVIMNSGNKTQRTRQADKTKKMTPIVTTTPSSDGSK